MESRMLQMLKLSFEDYLNLYNQGIWGGIDPTEQPEEEKHV